MNQTSGNKKTGAPKTGDKKKKKTAKPLRRAQKWGSNVLPAAGKLATVMLAVILLGMMFSALQMLDVLWLRIVLAVAILSGMLLIHFNEGANKGLGDAMASRSYEKLKQEGRTLTQKDDAACYHPLKALCAALVVYGVPLLLAVVVALNAKEYTYPLQDLPTWLSQTYGARGDVMGPLAAYTQTTGLEAMDWIRLIVRAVELVFVNLFEDAQKMSAAIDRLSPLFISIYPLTYMIGYLSGPYQQAKMTKMNKRAKKVAVRKAQKKSLVDELVGTGAQVHYGHKADTDKKKKKELI